MFSKIPSTFMHRKVYYVNTDKIIRSLSAPKEINRKLKEDILKNGLLFPLQIRNERSMKCLIGNQRLLILRSLRINKIPVIYITNRKKQPLTASLTHLNSRVDVKGGQKFTSGHDRIKKKRKKK